MSQDNQITLRGYVTAEPRFWPNTPTQSPVAEIRVGSTPRRLNRETGEWLDGDTSYFTVKCWRRLAVNVASCLRKGDMVVIRGKVVTRTWVDDQQRTRSQMQVEADSVGHDLSFGWSHFNRGVQTPQNAAQRLADGEMSRQDGSYDLEPNGGGNDPNDLNDLNDLNDDAAPAEIGDVTDRMLRDLGEVAEIAPVF